MKTFKLKVVETETYIQKVKANTKEEAIESLTKEIMIGDAEPVDFEDKEFSIKVEGQEIL